MAGTSRQLPKAHGPQLPAQRLLADGEVELLEHPLRQIDQPPPHHTVDRRQGAGIDDPQQRLALCVIEERRLARRFAVHQAGGAFRIEREHPIPNRLEPDAADPRRVRPAAAIINLGQGKKATALSRILRRLGKPPQIIRTETVPQANRCPNREPPGSP